MKSNDLSKRLATRFKKSKDFLKTIEKLQKEGYTTRLKGKYYTRYTLGHTYNFTYDKKLILFDLYVLKDNNELLYIQFENSRNENDAYKQHYNFINY